MRLRAKERRLNTPTMQMDYITFGSGDKPLVMLQGLSTRGIKGMAPTLAWLYRIYAKEYRVYLFDRKEGLSGAVTVRELAADLAAVMDALGLSGAAVLGVSQGGMIAQYLAIDRPDLVSRLVLVVTVSRNNDTLKAAIGNWIGLAEQGDAKGLVADIVEKMYSEQYVKRYRWLMPLLTVLQAPRDVLRFVLLAKACLTCDTYEMLDQIKCPVLVIGGLCDRVVSGEASREIADRLGCEFYLYEKLGHAIYEEARDFNQRVYDFLRK